MDKLFADKTILITGGTGSFGQKFVEVIQSSFSPKKLIVFSRDELKQSEMQQKFAQSSMRFFIGDVRDQARLDEACRDVDLIVHAAAMKQVPASEYNPTECIKTNIDGAQNVIKAALNNSVSSVIALSTDKAANPVNLYGATKLASDKLFIAANNIVGQRNTKFSVVRYGNVIGSRGSIVPLYQRLISENCKHLPVTHPGMTRFVITLRQGVKFVIDAFRRMQGGEIFVPKLPSVKVMTVAEALGPDLPTKIIGIRPGEKLHEVMCSSDDSHLVLEYDNHFVIKPSIQIREEIDYSVDNMGDTGELVSEGFEYQSGTNCSFLDATEFNQLVSLSKS